MFGEPVALPAQLLQLLRAERLTQHFVGVVPRVEAGAQMRLQQAGTQAVAAQFFAERLHGGAIERDAERISAWAPALRACCMICNAASSALSRSSSGVHSVP